MLHALCLVCYFRISKQKPPETTKQSIMNTPGLLLVHTRFIRCGSLSLTVLSYQIYTVTREREGGRGVGGGRGRGRGRMRGEEGEGRGGEEREKEGEEKEGGRSGREGQEEGEGRGRDKLGMIVEKLHSFVCAN